MLILLILWLSITNHLQESRAVKAEFGAGAKSLAAAPSAGLVCEGKAGGEGRREKPLLCMGLL